MTCRRPMAGSKFAKGVSLIELMISITIGLIIIGAVFSAYLGASGASRMADAQSHMDEDAQSALTMLAQQLRQAGVNPAQNWTDQLNYSTDTTIFNPVYLQPPYFATPTYSDPPYTVAYAPFKMPTYSGGGGGAAFALTAYPLRGCAEKFDNIETADDLDDLTCGNDTTLPNSFGVTYEADIYNTVPSIADATKPTDCLGNALTEIDAPIPQPPPPLAPAPASSSGDPASSSSSAPATSSTTAPVYTSDATYDHAFYYVADNRFFIDQPDGVAAPSLYCRGNGAGNATQALVENVEDMQVLYGTQTPNQPGKAKSGSVTVAGYLTADKLIAQGGGFTTDSSRWDKVITVRLCLQMRSANPVIASTASASFLKCDGTVQTGTDHYLHRTYTTTVVLRNKLL